MGKLALQNDDGSSAAPKTRTGGRGMGLVLMLAAGGIGFWATGGCGMGVQPYNPQGQGLFLDHAGQLHAPDGQWVEKQDGLGAFGFPSEPKDDQSSNVQLIDSGFEITPDGQIKPKNQIVVAPAQNSKFLKP